MNFPIFFKEKRDTDEYMASPETFKLGHLNVSFLN